MFNTKDDRIDFNKLVNLADEGYKKITSGEKVNNYAEIRNTVYAVDFIKFARENFGILERLQENEIYQLENVLQLLSDAYFRKDIDEETAYGYMSGILGTLGVFACHFKNAIWDNNLDDKGFKIICNNTIYPIDAYIREAFHGTEGYTITSIYDSIK